MHTETETGGGTPEDEDGEKTTDTEEVIVDNEDLTCIILTVYL